MPSSDQLSVIMSELAALSETGLNKLTHKNYAIYVSKFFEAIYNFAYELRQEKHVDYLEADDLADTYRAAFATRFQNNFSDLQQELNLVEQLADRLYDWTPELMEAEAGCQFMQLMMGLAAARKEMRAALLDTTDALTMPELNQLTHEELKLALRQLSQGIDKTIGMFQSLDSNQFSQNISALQSLQSDIKQIKYPTKEVLEAKMADYVRISETVPQATSQQSSVIQAMVNKVISSVTKFISAFSNFRFFGSKVEEPPRHNQKVELAAVTHSQSVR